MGTTAKVSNTITYAVVSCHHIPGIATSLRMVSQGVKLARTIGACFFQITEGKAQPPFQKNVGFVRFKC